MELTGQQSAALEKAHKWIGRHRQGLPAPQVFRLQGAAGTGKTELSKLLASTCRNPLYAAPTGKAASEMTRRGAPASTIHQLIYQPMDSAKDKLKELQAEEKVVLGQMEAGDATRHASLQEQLRTIRQKIRDEKEAMNRPYFALKTESILREADLLALDEGSMIDEPTGVDLESFGVPLLVMGDPFQLPPVRGTGYFLGDNPDVLLTEVHRQALGSPILELATMAREGRALPQGYDRDELPGRAQVVRGRPDPEIVMKADQILCGRNTTRIALNARCRALLGRTHLLPEPGDRLVCLKNNHELGLANGTIWLVAFCHGSHHTGRLVLDVVSEDGLRSVQGVEVHQSYFEGKAPERWAARDAEHFDYGYALTVHKAQGSQWDSVVLFDDWSGADRRQWLYTGITRAAKQLLVVQ